MAKAKNKKLNPTVRKKSWVLFATIFFATYFISLFIPLISGYTRFPVYVAICGKLPVVASDIAGKSYRLPGDEIYGPTMFANSYFCTENQAKDEGYRRN